MMTMCRMRPLRSTPLFAGVIVSLIVMIHAKQMPSVEALTRQYKARMEGLKHVQASAEDYSNLGNVEPFHCPPLPPRNTTANSVHELHPQDFKISMAMGDSITAAFGAMGRQGLTHDLLEWRGWSFSAGGASNASTLGTFLRHYSPDLIGLSLGKHEWEFCWGFVCPERRHPELDQLNAAQSFAMMYNLANGPGNQLEYLIKRLKDDSRVDMQNDWKLLTIYIGSNDMWCRL